jgi:hypothetical protein
VNLFEEDGLKIRRRNYTPRESDQKFTVDYNLNGERINHWVVQDYFRPDRDTITDVKLKAGVNVLLLKVINGPGACVASIRFTDEKGEPVIGFEAGTAP